MQIPKLIQPIIRPVMRWAGQPETRGLFNMVALIAAIHFVIEAAIMGTLSGWNLTTPVVLEGLLDCTLLTIFATPPIYFWVVKPFAISTRTARAALAEELSLRAEQATKLQCALDESRQLLVQNEDLRRRLQEASSNNAEINERILQRIGADLHDGPAQLLTYSLLRLNKLAPFSKEKAETKRAKAVQHMREAISDALREVRNISAGLSLPELQNATFDETIALAIAQHQDRTGTIVQVRMDPVRQDVPLALKVCAYRFVQEGLANAYRHGGAKEQRVEVRSSENLQILVSDKGLGLSPQAGESAGLGLSGMRARVEALGGLLNIQSNPGSGVQLTVQFDLDSLRETELVRKITAVASLEKDLQQTNRAH